MSHILNEPAIFGEIVLNFCKDNAKRFGRVVFMGEILALDADESSFGTLLIEADDGERFLVLFAGEFGR